MFFNGKSIYQWWFFDDKSWYCSRLSMSWSVSSLLFQGLYIFQALAVARDEIHWLLRHFDNLPPKKNFKLSQEDFVDRQLPELLFNMEELKCELWMSLGFGRRGVGFFPDFVQKVSSEWLFSVWLSPLFLALLRKYNQVVQRYFVQYLAGYDSVLLNSLIQVPI